MGIKMFWVHFWGSLSIFLHIQQCEYVCNFVNVISLFLKKRGCLSKKKKNSVAIKN